MKNKISILRGAASLALLSAFLALPARAQLHRVRWPEERHAVQLRWRRHLLSGTSGIQW